jgi:glutamate-5-semialdehyde dehydrogenase
MNILNQLHKAKEASRRMYALSEEQINTALCKLAEKLRKHAGPILSANRTDLSKMDQNDPNHDRLLLNKERIEGIAMDLESTARLSTPLGKVLENKSLQNGLHLQKLSVALGTIGVIYEARPNVTIDVFALCFKSGNACILKGSSSADTTNKCLVKIIQETLEELNMDKEIVQLLPTDRVAATELMHATAFVDVLIPRGSQALINSVRENSKVPVIETGAGIVHTYFDEYGDLEKGKKIVCNAKTRRVSVCNALDCLIIHKNRLNDLDVLTEGLSEKNVEVFADDLAFKALESTYPTHLLHKASKNSFGTEFLGYKMSIKTVNDIYEATEHIYRHSSKHSEAIISENQKHISHFFSAVDAAVVYANSSTAFTDGAQFGMGAEIGISTQKLHARGPMALNELSSYKWLVKGNGQIRD